MEERHRVVIIGGGFGGLYATKALKHAPVQVTLIDRRNFHLFQPLLYQVATGWLSPANISSPLRAILKRQPNATVLLGEVVGVDVSNRRVMMSDGIQPYDSLIVATGTRHHYFGNAQWETMAPGLKTTEDATEIRRRVLLAFEAAEREQDPDRVQAWLNFVIVGGGPTGVELAGALGEISQDTLRHDFRRIDSAKARILLVEATDRILPPYVPKLSAKASAALARLGVMVKTKTTVEQITPDGVSLKSQGRVEFVPARTVLWAAGMQASPLGEVLAAATGAKMDGMGRVIVEPDLSVAGHPEIFVIGDLANFAHQTGQPLPGIAQVAMQQGQFVAQLLRARLEGRPLPRFHFKDLGKMAIVGRAAAVAEVGNIRVAGFVAWLLWLFVHLIRIVEYENRLLVLVQWAWNYFTHNRSARLITGDSPFPLVQFNEQSANGKPGSNLDSQGSSNNSSQSG